MGAKGTRVGGGGGGGWVIPDGRFACRDDMARQVTPFRSVDGSAALGLTGWDGGREGGWRDSESFRDRTGYETNFVLTVASKRPPWNGSKWNGPRNRDGSPRK